MTTWYIGIDAMHRGQERDAVTVAQFLRQLRERKIQRVPGKAIFLTRFRAVVPSLITDHVRHMGAFYEEVVALSVRFMRRPRVRPEDRLRVERLGEGFWHVTVHFGFIENPDVAATLHRAKAECPLDPDAAVFFSERDHVVARKHKPRLAAWRRRLFALLYLNAVHPADRFNLPAARFVQISRQIEV